MGTKLIFILITLTFLSTTYGKGFPDLNDKRWTKKYDNYFKKYSKRFWGAAFDWRWFKAQAIAESNLDEDAKSWVGAKGIMQIMPRTFKEISDKNPTFVDVEEPRWNIASGIYYDKELFKKWSSERPLAEKLKFTFASYNGGFRNILKAQKEADKEGEDTRFWHTLPPYGPKVKSWRHSETIHYVEKIVEIMPGNQDFKEFWGNFFKFGKDKKKKKDKKK
jgi:membrane-bound lytic murein transglycosylase F